MQIWSAEIKELETLYTSIKGRFPELEKELEQLIRTDDANVVMLYSRRCLEVIITDLCECELKRPRKTEPLKGIIDKLNKEEKVPSHIITSMQNLNSLSTYGAHPKEFDPRQVKPVLNNLSTIIEWYLKYKDTQATIKPRVEEVKDEIKAPDDSTKQIQKPKKRLILLLSGLALVVVIIVVALFIFDIIGGEKRTKELEKSIAVLPFDNLSSDEEQAWFSDGITDVIINQLSKISDLRVLGRTSTLKYKEKEEKKSISEIGEELGVNFIIEGSVQKQEDQIRISVQLVRVKNEAHIWSDLYDKEWGEIFNIQTDIAKKIASNLKTILSPEETKQIENIGTDNDEAYRLYMIGNFLTRQFTEDASRKAIDNYKQAIALDSSFAQAYAGLASAYLMLSGWNVPLPSSEFISQARDWALKALEINENLGEAYSIIGFIKYVHEWDWNGAEQAFKKGMELNPNYVQVRSGYANFLTAMGRFEESITIGQQTLEQDPLAPGVYNELAGALMFNGQDEEALELFNKSLELNPNFVQTLEILVYFYVKKGLFNQAIFNWDKLLELYDNDFRKSTSFTLSFAGEAFAMAGRRDEAINILNELIRRTEEGEYGCVDLAYLYNTLGETEKAIEFFEKGFNKKEPGMVWINVLSTGDSIRSNKRFKELLRKMGLDD